ncbi:MAG: tyrosine-type recombinase/integrase [Bryobacteraceae bacterium]
MALRVRHGKWHYRFEIDGHEWTGNTGLVAIAGNRRLAGEIESEAWKTIRQGKSNLVQIQAIPFNDAADKFLAWADGEHGEKPTMSKRVRTSFASLIAYFGRTAVGSISAGDVLDYRAWRTQEHRVKDVTIRHDLHNLSKFFRYAIKHNWCTANAVLSEDIPSDKDAVRMHIFTPGEEIAYRHAAESWPKLHDLARLMVNQGCRPEELLNLELLHVDLHQRYLRIVNGKTPNPKRKLRLRAESIEILSRRMQDSQGRYLFCSERNPLEKLSLSTVENWHVKVRRNIGLPCVLYDWRHTFATRAAEAGMSLAALARILGHGDDLRSVMKYVHPSQREQDCAMEGLSAPENANAAGRKPDQSNLRQSTAKLANDLDFEGEGLQKPLFGGSIPPRASNNLQKTHISSIRSRMTNRDRNGRRETNNPGLGGQTVENRLGLVPPQRHSGPLPRRAIAVL